MVNYYRRLDATFAALSDPTRRAILQRMTGGPVTVGDLARPFKVSLPAISKHLRVLERAGLLKQSRRGRARWCHLKAEPLRDADRWIAHYRGYWQQQLDALAEFLESQTPDESRMEKENLTKRKGRP